MKYLMEVKITDPNTPAGMISELFFKLNCVFQKNENDYGNGHYVAIYGDNFYKQVIDLRYNQSFNCNEKEKWLEQWARSYWTGEDGAWTIKELVIEKQ